MVSGRCSRLRYDQIFQRRHAAVDHPLRWGSYDFGNAIIVDNGGDVLVTGLSFENYQPFYATIKYSSAGAPLWTNRYTGPLGDNSGNVFPAIAADRHCNVFVTGSLGTVAYSD